MKIRADFIFPPIPVRTFDWAAIDEDTYDGAPDSITRHQIGYGRTRDAAIEDLLAILADDD
ncbi:MAG TPA: hypothetical protein VFL96_04115 [Acidobacteriaceae bacterium]|nr:hypothetical protein [Acidobacteriaceae bacterium]